MRIMHEKNFNQKNKIRAIIIPNNHKYIEKLKESLEKRGIKVKLMPPFHYATPFNFMRLIFLKLKKYNIIHVQWVYIFPFIWFMKLFVNLSKKLGFKIIYTIHDIHDSALQNRLSSKQKVIWMYIHSDYRFIHYKSNIYLLKKKFRIKPKNIEIIYHPLFEESYPNKVNQKESRKWLSISEDKKVLLLFGKLSSYKGIEIFAKALQKLDNRYYGLMVGRKWDTYLVEEIKKLNLKNLKIIDKYIPDEELQYYFNACDVVVAPYLDITTSGIVLLAYSFAKPVITTSIGGLPEVVVDEKTGLLIPPNDVDALVNAIKKIFTMDYKKMGERAHKVAKEKFTWEKLAEQTIKVYEKVLEND